MKLRGLEGSPKMSRRDNFNQRIASMKKYTLGTAILAGLFVLPMVVGGVALASHNGAVVTHNTPDACGPTTFSATIADQNGTHKVDNMRLVVDDGDAVQNSVVPTDGTSTTISVGPFFTSEVTTVSWRVFGGGERDYDQPLWNGYGDPDFNEDVAAYGAENGFGFVVAGTDDPNPFTNWIEVDVQGCSPETKEDCMDGGWEKYGFSNQGQCVRFIETGKDSRA